MAGASILKGFRAPSTDSEMKLQNLVFDFFSTVKETGPPSHIKQVNALVQDVQEMIKFADPTEPVYNFLEEFLRPDIDVQFRTEFNGKIEAEPVGPTLKTVSIDVLRSAMKQLSKMTLTQIHHYAILGSYISDLYRAKQLVDTIIFLGDDMFTSSRHVLCCHSDFFAQLFLNHPIPAYAVAEVTLVNIDVTMFRMFLHFANYGDIFVTDDTVGPLMTLSEILESETLRNRVIVYVKLKSQPEFIDAIDDLLENPTPFERTAAIQSLVNNYRSLLDDPIYFKDIGLVDMKEVMSSSHLNILSELDVFWGVLFWTVCDQDIRMEHFDTLMSCVRFTCMTTLELLDCARATSMMSISTTCRKLLINAHWVCHAKELGLNDPLLLKVDKPRHHLVDTPPHVPTVKDFDSRYLAYKGLHAKIKEALLIMTAKPESESEALEVNDEQAQQALMTSGVEMFTELEEQVPEEVAETTKKKDKKEDSTKDGKKSQKGKKGGEKSGSGKRAIYKKFVGMLTSEQKEEGDEDSGENISKKDTGGENQDEKKEDTTEIADDPPGDAEDPSKIVTETDNELQFGDDEATPTADYQEHGGELAVSDDESKYASVAEEGQFDDNTYDRSQSFEEAEAAEGELLTASLTGQETDNDADVTRQENYAIAQETLSEPNEYDDTKQSAQMQQHDEYWPDTDRLTVHSVLSRPPTESFDQSTDQPRDPDHHVQDENQRGTETSASVAEKADHSSILSKTEDINLIAITDDAMQAPGSKESSVRGSGNISLLDQSDPDQRQHLQPVLKPKRSSKSSDKSQKKKKKEKP